MRRVATAVLIALSLAACGTARRPGFPRQSSDEDGQIRELERVRCYVENGQGGRILVTEWNVIGEQ